MIKVAALTSSSPKIGMGHVARTTQVLSTLDKENFEFILYGQLESIPHWINKLKYRPIDFKKIDYEYLNKYDLIIFDSYENREILNKINTKKLLIDDINHLGDSNTDVILDYNYGSKKELYPSNMKLLIGHNYFPISKNTYPEFLDKDKVKNYNVNGKILLSFGGVSDKELVNIGEQINFYKNFGEIILMDPMDKLGEYSKEVSSLIKKAALSEVLSTEEIKFCKLAGGTSKYLALSYGIPLVYVYRNKIEKTLIDNLYQDNLVIKENELLEFNVNGKLNSTLINMNKKYKKIFKSKAMDLISNDLLELF